ncbi:dual specificity phosphatase [Mycena leptocephala]|nr:dual specificity phosphatase [Mycena leptocephala]
MIAFDSVSPEEMEAMCTPMHRVLSPTPLAAAPTPNLPTNPPTKSAEASTGALYLGSMAAVHDTDLLRTHRIAHLVQVLEVPWMPQGDNDAGVACYRIDIQDRSSAALQPHLEAACNYIRTSLAHGDNVLVHCQQGVSRSASIVIAYLIRDRAMTYDAAFDLVKRRRQCIRPNAGFVKTLQEWESACKIPASR